METQAGSSSHRARRRSFAGGPLETYSYHESLAYEMVKVAHLVECELNQALSGEDLSLRQFAALAYIAGDPAGTQSELARRVLTSPQATRRLVSRLVEMGLVARTESGPGRTIVLELTALGQESLTRATTVVSAAEAALIDAVPAETAAALKAAIGDFVFGLHTRFGSTR